MSRYCIHLLISLAGSFFYYVLTMGTFNVKKSSYFLSLSHIRPSAEPSYQLNSLQHILDCFVLLIVSATNNDSSVGSFQIPYPAAEWEGQVSGAKVGEGTAHRGKALQRQGRGKGQWGAVGSSGTGLVPLGWKIRKSRALALSCPAPCPHQPGGPLQ